MKNDFHGMTNSEGKWVKILFSLSLAAHIKGEIVL